jgi:hypothetical protein
MEVVQIRGVRISRLESNLATNELQPVSSRIVGVDPHEARDRSVRSVEDCPTLLQSDDQRVEMIPGDRDPDVGRGDDGSGLTAYEFDPSTASVSKDYETRRAIALKDPVPTYVVFVERDCVIESVGGDIHAYVFKVQL